MSLNSINLEWKNLMFSVEKSIKSKWLKITSDMIEKNVILKSVSGRINSGELIAVLGSSGSGKTTLLAAISQRLRGEIDGEIFLNGEKCSRNVMTKISGFLPQHDIAAQHLTVWEHLNFMSQLKMDRTVTEQNKQLKINLVLKKLGLEDNRQTKVGMLSGGERKKLSLSTELLTEPLILFCDEPTTGLDSYNALSVMKTLRNIIQENINLNDQVKDDCNYDNDCYPDQFQNKLVRTSKVIVCSIHQPTSEIFECFSHIILMNSGRIVYQGGVEEAEIFFSKMDLYCPSNYNPAEFYVKLVRTCEFNIEKENNTNDVVEKIYENYVSNTTYQNLSRRQFSNDSVMDYYKNGSSKGPGWFRQVYLLLCRSAIECKRSLWNHFVATTVFLISSFTIAILYSNVISGNQTSVQDIQGSIILITTETIFSYSYATIFELPRQMPMIRRETGEKLYSLSSFYVSEVISKVPIIFLQCFLFVGIISLSVVYITDIGMYISMFIMVAACGIAANAYGCMLSGLFDSLNLSIQIAAPLDLLFLILGGFYVNLNSFPVLKYFSLFYFGNEGLSYIVWNDVKYIGCSKNVGHPCLNNGIEVLTEHGFGSASYTVATDYIGLIFIFIVMHLLGYLGLSRCALKVGYY